MALDINELNKLLEKGSDGKITHLDSVNIGNVKHSLWGLPVTFTVQEEKKKTLSDKIVKSYPSAKDLTHYKDCCYIEDVKQTFQKIKQRILNQTGNECDAKIARDYAIIIVDEEIGKRMI